MKISTQVMEEALANVHLSVEGQEMNLRQYLYTVLSKLWQDCDDFNSKRPFGYSSWQFDVYRELIAQGYIDGKLDTDGYIVAFENKDALEFMQQLISHIFFNK